MFCAQTAHIQTKASSFTWIHFLIRDIPVCQIKRTLSLLFFALFVKHLLLYIQMAVIDDFKSKLDCKIFQQFQIRFLSPHLCVSMRKGTKWKIIASKQWIDQMLSVPAVLNSIFVSKQFDEEKIKFVFANNEHIIFIDTHFKICAWRWYSRRDARVRLWFLFFVMEWKISGRWMQ